jgi:hypothetical protein
MIKPRNRHDDFEVQITKTSSPVLRSNQRKSSQWFWCQITDIDIGFEAQLRNTCFSSPRARYRPHTTSPNLSITWPPSTRRVLQSLVLFTRSLLLSRSSSLHVMSHLPPAHHEKSKHDSPNKQKIKLKQPNRPGFEFKPHKVNDSSQSNQRTDHLVSQKRCQRKPSLR